MNDAARRLKREWLKFALTRVCGLALDLLILFTAYLAAILLRFEFHAPRWGLGATLAAFGTVALVHFAFLLLSGVYRLAWRRTRLEDLPRYLLATSLSCLALTLLRFVLPVESYAHVRPPYSVTLISFVLATLALPLWRIVWSWTWDAYLKKRTVMARDVRHMDSTRARAFFAGKVVLVTGAGGSIGSELVRQVVRLDPARVLLVERGENALYEIDRALRAEPHAAEIVPLMKDVTNDAAMEEIFKTYHPDIVLHAAAYKHVPMVEMNPEEGWRNNTEGTKKTAALAKQYGAARFVLISTDKAVHPVSVMGQTKLAAERAIMAMNEEGETSFAAVRFGNVLGSSGSVVPLFREQIARRRSVTVTHPDMRRYFMTTSEAVALVLEAASRTERAIYTLDMGKSVRIVDLAETLIRQAGLRPYVDIPIVFTGVRPGEKLFEELDISNADGFYKTDMAKIYITKTGI